MQQIIHNEYILCKPKINEILLIMVVVKIGLLR